MSSWSVALLAATSVHAGFQVTVTTLVYPALTRLTPVAFASGHAAHSRSIVPLVAVVYGLVVVGSVGAVLDAPASSLVWVAALTSAAALTVTAVRAAPLHGRLGQRGPEPGLLRALLRADRLRTLLAVLAAVAAALHALTS